MRLYDENKGDALYHAAMSLIAAMQSADETTLTVVAHRLAMDDKTGRIADAVCQHLRARRGDI